MFRSPSRGFAALLSVIIIGSVLLTLAATVSLGALTSLTLRSLSTSGNRALRAVESCLDDVLARLRLNANWQLGLGPFGLVVNGTTCTVTITDLGSARRSIVTRATLAGYERVLAARVLTTTRALTLEAYNEVAN